MHRDYDSEVTVKSGWSAGDFLYPIALIAYLVVGFRWGLWHPGWLLFTIAWALEEVINSIRNGAKQTEFYGLASVVFLVMGFFFDLWQFSWLAFVVAAIIEYRLLEEHEQ